MKYAATILLISTFLIGELHTFWEKASQAPVNWIYAVSRPMCVQWNVKYLSEELNWLLVALALLLYRSNRVNRSAAIAYVFYRCADVALYLYNYKTFGYGFLYMAIALVFAISYLTNKR